MAKKKVFKNGKNDSDGYVVLETGKGGKGIVGNLPSPKAKKGIISKALPLVPKQIKPTDAEVNIPLSIPPVFSSELVIIELSKDGKYRITVDGSDLNSRVKVKFTNLENKKETNVPQDLIWGRQFTPSDHQYGLIPVESELIDEANNLLFRLSFKRNEAKVDFAQINKLNPNLRRIDNDGLDIGSSMPVFMIKDLPWHGWSDEVEDIIHSDSPDEDITQEYLDEYDGEKIVTYTPTDDEIVLRWVAADFNHGVELKKEPESGWGLYPWGNLFGLDSKPIAFAQWDDIEGISNIVNNMNNQKALQITSILLE